MDNELKAPGLGAAKTASERSTGAGSDAHLLERFLSGQEEVFALLVLRHGRLVFHLCQRILGNQHDAEDAFQATFLILARRAGAIRRQDALGSWLCGVATRVALRLKGQRQRRRSAEVAVSALLAASSGSLATTTDDQPNLLDRIPAPPNRSPDPAVVACQAEDATVLLEELGRLPEKYRAPLVLCYFEGRTTEEAAAWLRCPVGTFKSRLAKARSLIRTRLTRRGVVLTSTAVAGLLSAGMAGANVPEVVLQTTASLVGPAAPPLSPQVADLVQETLRALRSAKFCVGAAAGFALVVLLGVFSATGRPPPAPPVLAASTLPVPVAVGPTLVVANQRCGTVTLIDIPTGKIRASVGTDSCPHEVAVSPQGATAAVANYGLPFGPKHGHTITLIDVVAGKTKRVIDLGKYTAPHGLLWLDEDRLLCTCETAGALLEIDTQTGEVVRTLQTGQNRPHMLAVSTDRKRAYAANAGSHTVTVFDFATGAKMRDVEVGKGVEGIALSPDGRRLWVSNGTDKTVSVIDTADLRVVTTLPAPGTPFRIAFSPDGQTAIVTEPLGGELAVYEAATLKELKRVKFDQGPVKLPTPGPIPGPLAAVFAPDGKIAYCTVFLSNAVAVVDLEKGEVVNRFGAGFGPDGIAFVAVGAGG